MIPKLVGILNITPDSFSDGGAYIEPSLAIRHAMQLVSDGADVIDIGGDSTRPGSICAGADLEWRRISETLKEIVALCDVSVDTHLANVARLAIKFGAKIINDVSAGSDPEMFSVIADSNAKIVITHTRCSAPHFFTREKSGDLIRNIRVFFEEKIEKAIITGIRSEQIILDTGMGAFLSDNPLSSWELLRRFSELSDIEYPFMLGISRKGFFKLADEKSTGQRDAISALCAILVSERAPLDYLRVHDVAMHRNFYRVAQQLSKQISNN